MKKINATNKSISVQRNDLEFMLYLSSSGLLEIPKKIKLEFLKKVSELNDYTKYDFIEYTDLEIVKFLISQVWILDYNIIKLSLSDFSIFRASVDTQIEELVKLIDDYEKKYSTVSDEVEKKIINEKMHDLYLKLTTLNYNHSILYSEYLSNLLVYPREDDDLNDIIR